MFEIGAFNGQLGPSNPEELSPSHVAQYQEDHYIHEIPHLL